MARPNSEGAQKAIVAEVMEITDAFKGKRFSITGHLGLPRKEIVELIQRAGGFFDSEPKFGTNYLITNPDWSAKTIKSGTSRKLELARQNGIQIISEDHFFHMLYNIWKNYIIRK
ncbi:MAG TPA: BRCT domain-containing protein [Methylobacter sp.]|jgi:NAD-dependent DNA ligase